MARVLDLSPWVRDRLGSEFCRALEERLAQAGMTLSVSRGKSGWGATLIRRKHAGYDLIADNRSHVTPEAAINAALAEVKAAA